jgi:hypothetical protein
MVLNFQAFVDESESAATGEFVLAGYIAPAANWAQFAGEWESLLPYGSLANDSTYQFKMSEMAITKERMARVPAFYRVIRKYVVVAISIRLNAFDFARAKRRVRDNLSHIWGIHVGDFRIWENIYFFAFRQLLVPINARRSMLDDFVPPGEKIDFIFDDRGEKGVILGAWDDIVTNSDYKETGCFGTTPRFENDREFLPPQAADFWAWWVRRWYEEDDEPFPEKMLTLDFGFDKGGPLKHQMFLMPTYLDENDIFNALLEVGLQGHFNQPT